MEKAQCPSTDKWINRLWHTCRVEYCSFIKEVSTDICCNKVNLLKTHAKSKKPDIKVTFLVTHLHKTSRIGKSTETENALMAARGLKERRNWRMIA